MEDYKINIILTEILEVKKKKKRKKRERARKKI